MVTLKLTIEQVNTVLTALSERPYKEVNALIAYVFEEATKSVNSVAPPKVGDFPQAASSEMDANDPPEADPKGE